MNIQQRINAVMHALRGVEKTGRHQQGYAYAGHEAVNEAVRPLFVQHGIVQTVSASRLRVHRGGHLSMTVRVRWACTDDPASFVEGAVPIFQHCQSKAGNPTVQMSGQLLSYGVKNFTFKTLMLTDSNEPDSDTLPHDSPRAEPAKAAVPADMIVKADSVIAAFEMLQTDAALAEYKAHWRAHWSEVSKVPGFKERFLRALDDASKRLAPIT